MLNATELTLALSKGQFLGVILYEGPSVLDGQPIRVIANKITTKSQNVKTGDIVQTFILRADVKPTLALKTGQDSSVCGACVHRPALGGSCYVNVGQSVQSVFGASERRRYATPNVDFDPAILPEIFANRVCRLGTYGDPAAAPFAIWRHAFGKALAVNGYTHQWRDHPEFAALCMASVDTPEERADANGLGFRTFRVRRSSDPALDREVVCPASREAGFRTTCDKCRACGGRSAKAKADIVIVAHGATAKRFGA
jgi:hypothetical protein